MLKLGFGCWVVEEDTAHVPVPDAGRCCAADRNPACLMFAFDPV